MKIGIVSPYFYPWYGGITEHVYNLYRELKYKGHSVRLITPFNGGPTFEDKDDLFKIGTPIPVMVNGSLTHIPFVFRKRSVTMNILQKESFDILHLHQPLFCMLGLSFLRNIKKMRSQKKRCPKVIATFHACGGTVEKALIGIFGFYFRRFSSLFDRRIAVSAAAMNFVDSLANGPYHLIPNGIDIERFSTEKNSIQRFKDGVANILFVGRLEPRKGVTVLLESLEHISHFTPKPFRLIVVGNGLLTRYYRQKIPPSMRDKVHFIGTISSDELPQYYHTADIFCSPASYGESFGIVLIEAMAAGIPIIAGDNEGYRSVLRHQKNSLLVNPHDPVTLAKSIAYLLDNKEQCALLAEQGKRDCQKYSWQCIAEKIDHLYRDVLKSDNMMIHAYALHTQKNMNFKTDSFSEIMV